MFFFRSSNFVLAFLKQNPALLSAKEIIEFAVASVNDIVVSLGIKDTSLIPLLNNTFKAFSNEFTDIADLKYKLDIEYRKNKLIIERVLTNTQEYYSNLNLNKAQKLFIHSLINLQKVASKKAIWKETWVTDIIHMHLNRLFIDDPRKQEMAVYYFLSKYQRSAQAKMQNK